MGCCVPVRFRTDGDDNNDDVCCPFLFFVRGKYFLCPHNSTVRQQHLVVVREDWSVICFDHELQKVWKTPLEYEGSLAEGAAFVIDQVDLLNDHHLLCNVDPSFIIYYLLHSRKHVAYLFVHAVGCLFPQLNAPPLGEIVSEKVAVAVTYLMRDFRGHAPGVGGGLVVVGANMRHRDGHHHSRVGLQWE